MDRRSRARRFSRTQRRVTTRTVQCASSVDPLPAGPILPRSTRRLLGEIASARRHPGLQLDKLSSAGEMEVQRAAIEKVVHCRPDDELLRVLSGRRTASLESLAARRLRMTTRGPLTLHLSRSGALENAGIALHPIYGFVYLPGSGVKGLVRSWAETVWAPARRDTERAWRQIQEAFGWSPGSERHKKGWRPDTVASPEGAGAGRLVFHDAWPTRWPRLKLDIVNNHHVRYYAGEDDPGDWEDPRLVYFLAVGRDEEFDFSVSDRRRGDSELLRLACNWLQEALTLEGAGAKTAAGYGRFKPSEGDPDVGISPDFSKAGFVSERFDLLLVTPAFLAGADQRAEDCDLRPATLRGLLRWWWRTLHAGHLDRGSLRKLETVVWGDAQSGSPVRIAVDHVRGGEPEQYNKRDRQFSDLPKPDRRHRVTQGLFYASYGMAEGSNRSRWRWYRPAGSCWRVTLTVKSGRFDAGSDKGIVFISSKRLLEQVTAALWLLVRFGGAGSRSRKGFGSFDDITVPGIVSLEDCIASAKRFRETCKLMGSHGRTVGAPVLDEAREMVVTQATAWSDPWYALDQTGMVLQVFAKKLPANKRIALGLPRRIGRPGRPLKAEKGDRHASPALWSLATCNGGKMIVRLIAFPAAYLPERSVSKGLLKEFVDFAQGELSRIAKRVPSALRLRNHGQPRTRPIATGPRQREAPAPAAARCPKSNDRVEAVLLEEKTRKGGWKARHLDSGLQGAIQDSMNVPADVHPGQRVPLTVAYANPTAIQFRWAEPRTRKKKPARRGGSGPGGNRRRRYR